jgi:hypothetical protein
MPGRGAGSLFLPLFLSRISGKKAHVKGTACKGRRRARKPPLFLLLLRQAHRSRFQEQHEKSSEAMQNETSMYARKRILESSEANMRRCIDKIQRRSSARRQPPVQRMRPELEPPCRWYAHDSVHAAEFAPRSPQRRKAQQITA